MGLITPKNGLVPKYLFHLMTSESYKNFIGELADGANINNLKFEDLRRFPVPHPDRSEQERIVRILDTAFAAIKIAKINTDKNLQKQPRSVREPSARCYDSIAQNEWAAGTSTSSRGAVRDGWITTPPWR